MATATSRPHDPARHHFHLDRSGRHALQKLGICLVLGLLLSFYALGARLIVTSDESGPVGSAQSSDGGGTVTGSLLPAGH